MSAVKYIVSFALLLFCAAGVAATKAEPFEFRTQLKYSTQVTKVYRIGKQMFCDSEVIRKYPVQRPIDLSVWKKIPAMKKSDSSCSQLVTVKINKKSKTACADARPELKIWLEIANRSCGRLAL